MRRAAPVLAAVLLTACSATTSGGAALINGSVEAVTTSSAVAIPASTSSTSSTTTVPATTTTTIPDLLGEEVIGTSAQGRPITAYHRGTPGGIVVLVVGVIHGNEDAGLAILDDLRTMPVPAGFDLWLLPALNPDGLANGVRGNGNGVDLNRNFPHDWTAIAAPGDWEYSGTGPASEPETQAFMAFAERIHPTLTLWYHQDAHTVAATKGKDGPLRRHYAQRTGLDQTAVTGGTYTGVAATWVRRTIPDSMSFIIELGPTLSPEEAQLHATVLLETIAMIPSL